MYDIAVIGGGVVGGLVLREIKKYDLSAVLIERESDVCMGQSKANSGIAHAGHDAKEGTLKARFNVAGSRMMPSLAKELGVKYKNNGSLVVAFNEEESLALKTLEKRAKINGVEDVSIVSGAELKVLEPHVSDKAIAALFAKTGAIVCPYELTIAAVGNAMDNGADLELNFDTESIEGDFGNYVLTASGGRKIKAKAIVNCAGAGAQKIAELIGDRSFKIGFRKGEYLLLDRESGDYISHTLFFTPTKKGKGVLITPTVDGNILTGPTAEEVDTPLTDTSAAGISFIMEKAKEMCPDIPFYNVITSFSGVRAYSDRHDFIIEESKVKRGFINCAGIESPGLTASPAIAKYVVNELIGRLFKLNENKNFSPVRKPFGFFKELSDKEKNEIIKSDPAFGHIVCRCEQITEGEILEAIRQSPKATDVDGIKRRTRSGMGRCQGGFCLPYVAEILSKELGVPIESVTKCGVGSEILAEKTK